MPVRLRIIRQVTRMGQDGKPKVVRDRREDIKMERVKAKAPRPCKRQNCPTGVIAKGEEYAKISPNRRTHYGHYPEIRDYHFDCVPNEAKPMVRFLT